MKREGRQHGMVPTFQILPPSPNPRPESKFINKLDSPPTAGRFNRVTSKPTTNHSKFTGNKVKCNECRIHPASKSKEKCKGTMKVRSSNLVSNCGLISWRDLDGRPGLSYSGISASAIVDHLAREFVDCGDVMLLDDCVIGEETDEDDFDEFSDEMSFCELGFVMEEIGEDDEGWCLVGEL